MRYLSHWAGERDECRIRAKRKGDPWEQKRFWILKKSSEGIIRLQAGVCDSAGACIQKVPEQKHQGHTGGSWYCAHSWHSTTSFLSINEKENQSWEGTLLTCCPASEQQLQADGAAAAVLRSLGSLGEWASGKANGEEAVMGAQDGRFHCTA